MEDDIKRWTATRTSGLVLDIIQGKETLSEASRQYDLSPSAVEQWVDDAKRDMEKVLCASPLDINEQYDRQLKNLQETYDEARLELRAGKTLQALLVEEDKWSFVFSKVSLLKGWYDARAVVPLGERAT